MEQITNIVLSGNQQVLADDPDGATKESTLVQDSSAAAANIEALSILSDQSPRSTLSTWRQLLGVLRRFGAKHRRWLVNGVAAAVGVTVLRLALPWPLHALLLPFLQDGQAGSPAWVPAGLDVTLVAGVMFTVSLAALGFADARVRLNFARFSISTVRDLRKSAMRGLSRGTQAGSSTRSGDMVARLIGDTARVKAGLKGFLVHVAVNGLLLIGIVAVMLYIDVKIGILFAICIGAVLSVTFLGARSIYKTAAKYRKKEGRLAQAIVKVAKFAKRNPDSSVSTPVMPRKVLATYKSANRSSGRSEARITRLTGYATWAAHALLGIFVLAALSYGARAVEAGTLSSANLLLFALYVLSARTPVVQLARQGVRTGKILACLGRLEQLVEMPGTSKRTPSESR